MNSNIIKIAGITAKILLYLSYFAMAAFTIGLIYWLYDPAALAEVKIRGMSSIGQTSGQFEIGSRPETSAIALGDLNRFMVFWLYFQIIFYLGIFALIIQKVQTILNSITQLKTFIMDNIRSLRDMAKLGVVLFLFSSFQFFYANGDANFSIQIAMGPLLFTLACLVLAEVFNEGRKLLEEKNLIV
ncbi:MAG: DUF2975 domain-containing protein [Bacteroidetes bacterium]|jgi:heme exporter protein D|nr:DUF2975 domain-containing protein [Bacteroidota bacterium]